MTESVRWAVLRIAAVGAAGAFLLSACTPSPTAPADPPSKAIPTPTEEWGEWSDVDALVAPVGSTPDRVIVSGIGSSLVVALDRSTGEEVWRIGDEQEDGADDGYASEDDWDDWESGPVWEHGLVLHDDNTVYTQRGSGDGSLVAYSADDGTERWRMAPGDLDVCATADGWELSPSVLKSYTVADSGRLILSHTEIADWDCHDGPNATHPGRPAMVVVDAQTGDVVGDTVNISGTSIPGLALPDPSGRYIDVPYELQSSVNIVRVDAETGDEQWAMLHYPTDIGFDVTMGDPEPPTVTAAGGERFLIHYATGEAFLATIDAWAQDGIETGEVTVDELGGEMPCEYRMQRSSAGDPYCLLMTSSPDPAHEPQFQVALFDSVTGARAGDLHSFDVPESLLDTDEYYGVVFDSTEVASDALVPAAARQTDSSAIILPSEDGLVARDLGTDEVLWNWAPRDGTAVAPHVIPAALEAVVGLDDRVVGLDALTGEELWDEPADAPLFGVGNVVTLSDYVTATTRVRTTFPVG